MQILSIILSLAVLVCVIIILVDAFKASVAQGFLSLCIPFYIFYYAFARFEHPNKGVIVGVWLGALVLNIILSLAIGVPSY